MRIVNSILALLIVNGFVFSQTNVDKLVQMLDSLSTTSFDSWKVSLDLKNYKHEGDPTLLGKQQL
jgi:hypothetical protein